MNPIITAKVHEILECQAVNLWLVKDEQELLLMDRDGDDPTREVGSLEKRGKVTWPRSPIRASLF